MNFKIACNFNYGCNTEINDRAIYTDDHGRYLKMQIPKRGNSEFRNDNNDKSGGVTTAMAAKAVFCGRRLRLREPIFASSLLG